MKSVAIVLGLLAASPAAAQPLLHPMFADHAILQRDRPIRVYGAAHPGADVSIHMGTTDASARASASGQWTATLPAMAAGGPYTLQVSSQGESQQIADVLVGDVFLCTGQSNMQLS